MSLKVLAFFLQTQWNRILPRVFGWWKNGTGINSDYCLKWVNVDFVLNNVTVFITFRFYLLPVIKIAKLTFRSNNYSITPEDLSLWGSLLPNSSEVKEFKHEFAVNSLIRHWIAWKKLCPRLIKIDRIHWPWIPWLISRSLSLHIAFRQGQLTTTVLKYAKDGTLNSGVEKNFWKYSQVLILRDNNLSNQNYFPRRDSTAIAPALSGLLKIQWLVPFALPVVL